MIYYSYKIIHIGKERGYDEFEVIWSEERCLSEWGL